MTKSGFIVSLVSFFGGSLTIIGTAFGVSRWLKNKRPFYYLAKSRDKVVKSPFSYHDVHGGISFLVERARAYDPDTIVGINRGGAIVGGILGKHLIEFVRIIEVKRDSEEPIFCGFDEDLANKKVLLIDDRVTQGKNLSKAYDYIAKRAADVRCMVFAFVETETPKRSPNDYAYKVISREIPLPWEPGAVREWK